MNEIIEPAYQHDLSKYFLWSLDTSRKTMESLYPANHGSLENKRSQVNEMLNMINVQQRNLQVNIDSRWKEAEELAIALIYRPKEEYHNE